MDASEDPVTSGTLLALQPRAVDGPWLPRLKAFECMEATVPFIPSIPLFLSPKAVENEIKFDGDTPILAITSMVSRFSTLCPGLEYITLHDLSTDPVVLMLFRIRFSVATEILSERSNGRGARSRLPTPKAIQNVGGFPGTHVVVHGNTPESQHD